MHTAVRALFLTGDSIKGRASPHVQVKLQDRENVSCGAPETIGTITIKIGSCAIHHILWTCENITPHGILAGLSLEHTTLFMPEAL